MTRAKFLSLIATATATVTKQVAKTHETVLQAEQANKEGKAVSQIEVDIPAYTKRFTDPLIAYANKTVHNTVDTKPCIDKYMVDKDYVEAYVRVSANALIKRDMQDVRDTATKADALLDTMASLTQQGKEEAAKPDGQYGENVDAILAAVDKAVSKAQWNNAHVDTVIYDLKFATDVALTLSDAYTDITAARDYGTFCMRRIVSTL